MVLLSATLMSNIYKRAMGHIVETVTCAQNYDYTILMIQRDNKTLSPLSNNPYLLDESPHPRMLCARLVESGPVVLEKINFSIISDGLLLFRYFLPWE